MIALSCLLVTINKFPDILIFSSVMVFIIFIAKLEVRYIFINLRKFYYVFLFLALMYIVFANDKIIVGLIVLWRFLMLILLSLTLTYTTPISDLTLAIEKISMPLKTFGIKPRNIAVMLSIAIRFIPVMFLRFEKLREGMLSRLADFRKLKIIKILLISLLEKLFVSASNLSDAMNARLYNEDAESSKIMRIYRNDYVSLILFFIFMVIMLSRQYVN